MGNWMMGVYEVELICNWLLGSRGDDTEEQSLEVKVEKSMEMLLEDELHGMSCWCLVFEGDRRVKLVNGFGGRRLCPCFDFFLLMF